MLLWLKMILEFVSLTELPVPPVKVVPTPMVELVRRSCALSPTPMLMLFKVALLCALLARVLLAPVMVLVPVACDSPHLDASSSIGKCHGAFAQCITRRTRCDVHRRLTDGSITLIAVIFHHINLKNTVSQFISLRIESVNLF